MSLLLRLRYVLRLLVSSSLYAVLPVPCLPLPARRGIRLCVSWGLHGDAMFPRLWRCWRLGESNRPYRPLAVPSQALDVVARTRYESLGGQHLIVAAIPGLSQERCCETTRADFSVAWVPPASPLPSSAARVCLGKGRISCETMTLASLRPSWTCHSPSRSRVAILFHRFMSVPHRHILRCCEHPFTTGGLNTHP